VKKVENAKKYSRLPESEEMYKLAKIAVVMPAHNEEHKIVGVLKDIPPEIAKKTAVIDDGGSDRTGKIAKDLGFLVMRHETNMGVGAAYKTGYNLFVNDGVDVIVTLHSDGQHDPNEISKLIQPILDDQADYVLGSRLKADEINMTRVRTIGNKLLTWCIKKLTGYELSDSQTGYHAIKTAALKKLNYGNWSNGFPCETDALVEASRKGLRVLEVPVRCIYSDRSHVSAISDGPKILWAAIKGRLKWSLKRV
jgi:glycosyltransferase involved in cell wall biosynthesis